MVLLWTAAELITSEPALSFAAEIPFLELLLTAAFLAIVAAARWRHAVLAVVRPRSADHARRAARRERRAS